MGVAPAPWSYAVLTSTLLVLVGGVMIVVDFDARAGSHIALVGASAFAAWAAGMTALFLYRIARGVAITDESVLWFFGVLILLAATAEWAGYRALGITKTRQHA